MCPAPLGYRSCLHNVGILSRQFEGTESEKPNGHQSGNMGEKTEDRYSTYRLKSGSRRVNFGLKDLIHPARAFEVFLCGSETLVAEVRSNFH